ncbi:long-chain fatty acid--CoA ligase [Striga asiatica]|uniref:Long-chain fatty acid--CoA ligase n=1 Tax=Striga asiatica TaxID=4170 RepID=A0A5A7PPU4_STRAF|nr:long-chain fatty acid--CoA ligase [Striga asiatica]
MEEIGSVWIFEKLKSHLYSHVMMSFILSYSVSVAIKVIDSTTPFFTFLLTSLFLVKNFSMTKIFRLRRLQIQRLLQQILPAPLLPRAARVALTSCRIVGFLALIILILLACADKIWEDPEKDFIESADAVETKISDFGLRIDGRVDSVRKEFDARVAPDIFKKLNYLYARIDVLAREVGRF